MFDRRLEPRESLNALRTVVRTFAVPADRLRESIEDPRPGTASSHPLDRAEYLRVLWERDRTTLIEGCSLPDDAVAATDSLARLLQELQDARATGDPVDDVDGPVWARVRAYARTIVDRTPDPRDPRGGPGVPARDVLPTVPTTEAGLRRLIDVIEGVEPVPFDTEGVDPREVDTKLSEAVAGLAQVFPEALVEEVHRRALYTDRRLTWGIHLMGDLPIALRPLLVEGYLEAAERGRTAWLGLLVDYPQYEAREHLIRGLLDRSEWARTQAAVALRRIGDRSAADAISRSLATDPPRDPELRRTMEFALAALRRP